MTLLALPYGLAIAVIAGFALNRLWMTLRRALWRRHEADLPPLDPTLSGLPRVTVQLPVYNEAYVVERLIDAAAELDYPRQKLEIQILDDSTDLTSEIAASRASHWRSQGTNVVHIKRTARAGFKAGALQEGLESALGEFVAVFDADFVPPPEFLLSILPWFTDDGVAMVQARWSHLDGNGSMLKRVQAFGLDSHFALEQWVRSRAGFFMNFNGSAGVWRRRAIEDAGGWSAETLSEDVDLSYRAQLRGWRMRYAHHVEVPAEIPADMNALRSQQFRWTKGTAEVARKLLGPLLASRVGLLVRLQGVVHLTSGAVFPSILVAAILHAPLAVSAPEGEAGAMYLSTVGLVCIGLAGLLVRWMADRGTGRPHRHLEFLLYVLGTVGISLSNAVAVTAALSGRKTAFVRTPKYPDTSGGRESGYRNSVFPTIGWAEAGLLAYCVAGAAALVSLQLWAALPLQLAFTVGFGLISLANLNLVMRRASPTSVDAARNRALPCLPVR